MKCPTWIAAALIGSIAGAAAITSFGFGIAGWTTRKGVRSAVAAGREAGFEENARKIKNAVAAALTPYCVDRSKADPGRYQVLLDLKAVPLAGKIILVQNAGWATPPGANKPDPDLALSCLTALNLL